MVVLMFLAIIVFEVVFFLLAIKFNFNLFVNMLCAMLIIPLSVATISIATFASITPNIDAKAMQNNCVIVEHKIISSHEKVEENNIGRHSSYETEYIVFEVKDGNEIKLQKNILKNFNWNDTILVCEQYELNDFQKFWYTSKTLNVYYTKN